MTNTIKAKAITYQSKSSTLHTSTTPSSAIQVEHLSVDYTRKRQRFTALEDVSFNIAPGEFVSIIGSSGCGKSTLLGVLEGLIAPTSGTVRIEGQPVTGPGPERSVVFQQYALFPWLTALGNVTFALEQAKPQLTRAERKQLAAHYLERVGLAGFEQRYPKELSGGQQQRVAIARALAEDGDILLMDEPFGAIDAKNRAILQDLLLELWEGEQFGTDAISTPQEASSASTPTSKPRRKTVVFITHDLDEAILLSDRIILLEADHASGIAGHVRQEFTVPLGRPRHRLEMLRSPEYSEFRAQVSEIFFEDEPRFARETPAGQLRASEPLTSKPRANEPTTSAPTPNALPTTSAPPTTYPPTTSAPPATYPPTSQLPAEKLTATNNAHFAGAADKERAA